MDPWPQCSVSKTELLIKALTLFSKSLLWIFSAASEPPPLFSAVAAAGVIAVLYIPYHLLSIVFSPVFLSTLFLLFTLLRFGSPKLQSVESDSKLVELPLETERCLLSSSPKQLFCETSLEWGGWGRPLEIIYEEYEGEEEKSEDFLRRIEGFSYSDADMEREETSPESICFLWDEEADGLIEIALEEDNMFEIDLSTYR